MKRSARVLLNAAAPNLKVDAAAKKIMLDTNKPRALINKLSL